MAKRKEVVMSVAEVVKTKRSLKSRSKQLKGKRISQEALPKLAEQAELEMARSNARLGVG